MSIKPLSSRSLRQTLGFSHFIILQNSSWNLSIEIDFIFLITSGFEIDFKVSFSIVNPSCPAKRMALIGLNPSSPNLSRGLPTVRIVFRLMSPIPSNGSFMVPSFKSAAMAFIVKSRRLKSSSMVLAYSTLSGCLPSL